MALAITSLLLGMFGLAFQRLRPSPRLVRVPVKRPTAD